MPDTLIDLLQRSCSTRSSTVAVADERDPLRYPAFRERVRGFAGVLRAGGLERQRIAILLPNTASFPVALYSILWNGGSALLLNPANSPRENGEQLADAGVRTVLTTERLQALLPPGCDRILVAEQSGDPAAAAEPIPSSAGDEAVVIFTSGMEGRMRGAVLTHRNLVVNARSTMESMGVSAGDRVIAALPFAHAFGLTVTLIAPLSAGGTVLPVSRFNPAAVLEMFGPGGATMMAGVPAMYVALLSAAEKKGVPAHALRLTLCGGAPLALDLARRWEEVFGIALRQGYGLTEAAPVCLFNHVDQPDRPGSLGIAFPGVELSVRDATGEELAAGEVGELCVRGENVFPGYLDGSTEGLFHGPWLRTGDLATLRDGVVHFRGLVKKMFTRNGFNIYPEEIRRVMRTDPRIEDARVLARPDPIRENEIVLDVRVRAGEVLSEEAVRELCQRSLASYKQPTEIRLTLH